MHSRHLWNFHLKYVRSAQKKHRWSFVRDRVFFFLFRCRVLFGWNEIWNRDPNREKEKNEIPMVAAIAPVLHLSHTFQTFRLLFDEKKTHNTRISSHVCAIYGWCLLLQRLWRWVNSMFKKNGISRTDEEVKNERNRMKPRNKREW